MKMTSGRDSQGRIRIGYWWSKTEQELPRPTKFIDKTWSTVERDRVALYLENVEEDKHTKGWSSCRCRFCDKENGGCDMTDGIYIWPFGFSHYLRHHAVKPTDKFIQHVLSQIQKRSQRKPEKPAKPKRQKQKRHPAVFDDYCPVCRVQIGWGTLALLFEGKSFLEALKVHHLDYDCPHCDCSLEVEVDVFFGLRQAPF